MDERSIVHIRVHCIKLMKHSVCKYGSGVQKFSGGIAIYALNKLYSSFIGKIIIFSLLYFLLM